MKRNKNIILVIGSLIIILAGCSKYCPDFNYSITQWMPYKEADHILISNSNKVDTLVVNYSEITHTDKYPRFSLCLCQNIYSLTLSSDSLRINILFQDSEVIEESRININDESLGYQKEMDHYTINGNTYQHLIVYQNSSYTSPNRFDSIIVAKSVGIISIAGPLEEWIIVDPSLKEINNSDIRFKSEDC
ncbi:MAG: hypothetical protein ISS19_06600 [Bacteroidales bacterium]|nr:hypothetical protein [Bacteroidales bacterium]